MTTTSNKFSKTLIATLSILFFVGFSAATTVNEGTVSSAQVGPGDTNQKIYKFTLDASQDTPKTDNGVSPGDSLEGFSSYSTMYVDRGPTDSYADGDDILSVTEVTNGGETDGYAGNEIDNFGSSTKFMDSNHNNGYDDGEAIISSGDDVYGSGDSVTTPGSADLNNFNSGNYFHLDATSEGSDKFNGDEAILDDTTGDTGNEIDSGDTIVETGKADIREFDSSATGNGVFVTGSNPTLDDGDLLYVEDGSTGSEYNPGEDTVITTKGSASPDTQTSTVTQLNSVDSTNVAFISVNDDQTFDFTDNSKAEPVVILDSAEDVADNQDLTTADSIATAATDSESYVEIGGDWDEGTGFHQDLSGSSIGPNANSLEYADSGSGTDGDFDTGEMIIEEGGSDKTLEDADVVVKAAASSSDIDVDSFTDYSTMYIDRDGGSNYEDGDDILSVTEVTEGGENDGYAGNEIDNFASTVKYDDSGSYEDGDSIVDDVDDNGYYGDTLSSLDVTNTDGYSGSGTVKVHSGSVSNSVGSNSGFGTVGSLGISTASTQDVFVTVDIPSNVASTEDGTGITADVTSGTLASTDSISDGDLTANSNTQTVNVPHIIETVTKDSDDDGDIDDVVVKFSESVDISDSGAGNAGLSLSDDSFTVTNNDYSNNGVDQVTLDLSSEVSGTSATTSASYNSGASGSIVASASDSSELSEATSQITATDGAAPQITDVEVTAPTKVQASFSEQVAGSQSDEDLVSGDFEYNGDQSVSSVSETGLTSTATLTLSNEVDNSDLGSDTVDVASSSVYDSADNAAPTDQDVTVNDDNADDVAPSITSASTMDKDSDGQVDHYKVDFDEAVDDSTASISSKWSVSGYSNLALDSEVSGDTDNDDVIYISFDESGSADTDATPDLTVTGATLEDASSNGNVLPDVGSGEVSESDGAAPVVTEFEAQVGSRRATVNFSEPVTDQSSTPEALASGDFAYADDSDGDVGSISEVSHDKSAEMATVILNKQATSSDKDSDKVNFKSGEVEDKASNPNSADTATATMADSRDQISLTEGWNLVSTPQLQAESTSELLSGVEYSGSPLTYDDGQWVESASEMNLDEMDAVYINSDKPQEIELDRDTGVQNTPQDEVLETGWNLVGPSLNVEGESELNADISVAFNGADIGDDDSKGITNVVSPLGNWDQKKAEGFGSQQVEAFRGYWVFSKSQEVIS